MNPFEVKEAIKLAYVTKQPLMITGAPGAGKSSIVAQTAKDLGIQLHDLRATLLEPVDISGVPHTFIPEGATEYRTDWAIPQWLPRTGSGILFLDEITTAAIEVQVALYSLTLDRRINNYFLPDDWVVVAAGNRLEDRANVNAMPSPLANRFFHASLEVTLNDWLDWAAKNKILSVVTSFIQFKPEILNDFNPKESAFPTPRSWEKVSTLLTALHNVSLDTFKVIQSCVGEGAAIEFIAFYENYADLPLLNDIINDPDNAKIPTSIAGKYAISGSLAHNIDSTNMASMYQYIGRFPGEYQVLMIKESIRLNKNLLNSPIYQAWAIKNSEKIL